MAHLLKVPLEKLQNGYPGRQSNQIIASQVIQTGVHIFGGPFSSADHKKAAHCLQRMAVCGDKQYCFKNQSS